MCSTKNPLTTQIKPQTSISTKQEHYNYYYFKRMSSTDRQLKLRNYHARKIAEKQKLGSTTTSENTAQPVVVAVNNMNNIPSSSTGSMLKKEMVGNIQLSQDQMQRQRNLLSRNNTNNDKREL